MKVVPWKGVPFKTCTLNNCSSSPPVRHPVVPLTIQLWPKKKTPIPPPPAHTTAREAIGYGTYQRYSNVQYGGRNECRIPITRLSSCHASSWLWLCMLARKLWEKKTQQRVCARLCVCARDRDCVSSNLRRQLLSINHKRAKREPLHFYHHYQYGAGLWKN